MASTPKITKTGLSTKLGGASGYQYSSSSSATPASVQQKLLDYGTTAKKFSTPDVASLAEKYKAANSINYTSAADEYASNQPTAITGLGSDYFNSLRTQRLENLRNEFFGDLTGKFEQGMYGESAAGRLGSGVAKTLLQETVTRPYLDEYSSIESDVYQQQQEEAARVEQFNAEQMSSYNETLAQLRAQDANVELKINELANTAALAEAGLINDNEVAAAKLQLDSLIAAMDDYRREQEIDQVERQIPYPANAEVPTNADYTSIDNNALMTAQGNENRTKDERKTYAQLIAKSNPTSGDKSFIAYFEKNYPFTTEAIARGLI